LEHYDVGSFLLKLIFWVLHVLITKKPGNIFIDSEDNIRLGDFGLATKRQEKPRLTITENETSEAAAIYDAIEDFSTLIGRTSAVSQSLVSHSSAGESMTGGVGTTFYRAPEQEGMMPSTKGTKGDTSYGVKADIYSFGIVVFEMFNPPFNTYMERSETLNQLRNDQSNERFPPIFKATAPKNAQDVILWCLERDPAKRPSSQELLKVRNSYFDYLRLLLINFLASQKVFCARAICFRERSKWSNGI
jgi:translation initiation factor 2-alpha kinase 4